MGEKVIAFAITLIITVLVVKFVNWTFGVAGLVALIILAL